MKGAPYFILIMFFLGYSEIVLSVPCKEQGDCTRCEKKGAFTLGTCFDGLCSCVDTDFNDVPPKDCTEVVKKIQSSGKGQAQVPGNCKSQCDKASTPHIIFDKAFLCDGDSCYCQGKLKDLSFCKNRFDCLPRPTKCMKDPSDENVYKNCKARNKQLLVDDGRCQSDLATCISQKGICTCKANSVLGTKCKPEKFCKVFCDSAPFRVKNGEGQICATTLSNGTTVNNCYCRS